jgi:hypothetical protein
MMQNMISEDLKFRILSVNDKEAEEKSKLHHCFEGFFTQSISDHFIDMYGLIEQELPTQILFENKINQLIQSWIIVLNDANITVNPDAIFSMKLKLQQIEKKALSYCKETYLGSSQNQEQTSESQKEMHQQSDKDQELEQEQNMEVDKFFHEDRGFWDTKPKFWTLDTNLIELLNINTNILLKISRGDSHGGSVYDPIISAMPKPNKFTSHFDKNIWRSHNFEVTAGNDWNHTIHKQIHALLMIQTEGELKCVLLTFKEGEHIKDLLEKEPPQHPNYIWVVNTCDTLYAGKPPTSTVLNKNYENMIQQLKFYNGDLKSLSHSDLSGTWLMLELEEKLQYFEQHLLPLRMTDKQEFNHFKKVVLSLNQAFKEVSVAPEKPLNEHDFKQRYPLINHSNKHVIEKFHHFCQLITATDSLNSPLFIPEEFSQPYYFDLILFSSNESLFDNYVTHLDNDTLKNRLVQELRILEFKLDFSTINSLFSRLSFTDPNKKSILLEAINQAFSTESFVQQLITHCSDNELEIFLSNLSTSSKQQLLEIMDSTILTEFMAKDISIIKALCDDLGCNVFNEKVHVIGALGVIIKESKYGQKKYSYEYLWKNPEKLNYFQTHASKEYLKAFFNYKPLGDLFIHLCKSQDPDPLTKLFIEIYELFTPSLPLELEESLWEIALSLSSSGEGNYTDPQEFLREKLSLNSYFSTLKQDTNKFLSLCSNEESHEVVNFFYSQLTKLKSDKEITDLLTTKLRGERGNFYYKTLLDVLENMENKPKVFDQLYILDIKAQLLQCGEKMLNRERFCYIDSLLEKYSDEYLKQPANLTPISQLRLDNLDSSSRLIVDIVEQYGDESAKKLLAQVLIKEQEVPIPSKDYEPGFFKSNVTSGSDSVNKSPEQDETKKSNP